jgi:cellulose synthase/poly-beta-1,6-N-acetylglucosamine synthase-like glycosyltransferase
MNETFTLLYQLIQGLLIAAIGLPVLYIFLFAAAGIFYRQSPGSPGRNYRRIAVLIPCYKEDLVIREVAANALSQEYPGNLFDVVIIADSLLQETLDDLAALPVKLIEVSFEKSTKSLALNKAMEILPESYDIAVILDADNLMEPGFLLRINSKFDTGTFAVQGHRKARNLDTSLAVLDAISEEINNHIFRKGHRVLGFSAALIGSGMAFRYLYFKDMMRNVRAVGGFDKEIELHMLKEGKKILYLDDAVILDEKVQTGDVFTNQRRRWLSSQLIYLRKDLVSATKALVTRGNIDYFDKIIQFIQPPRVLLLGTTLFSSLFFLLLNRWIPVLHFLSWAWGVILLLCVLVFVLSVPRYFYTPALPKALLSLPKGMVLMLGSLLRIRGANIQFIHTRHTVGKSTKS